MNTAPNTPIIDTKTMITMEQLELTQPIREAYAVALLLSISGDLDPLERRSFGAIESILRPVYTALEEAGGETSARPASDASEDE